MLSEQLYVFTQLIRHEKWSEAETIALNISSLDHLESKFRYNDLSRSGQYLLFMGVNFTL